MATSGMRSKSKDENSVSTDWRVERSLPAGSASVVGEPSGEMDGC